MRTPQFADRGGEFGVERAGDRGAVEALESRAGPVGGEVEAGQAVQLLAPEGAVPVVGALALPGRDVGEPGGGGGRRLAPVQGEQLGHQQLRGPAVGHQMVHQQRQDVVLGAAPHQQGTQQGTLGGVERERALGVDRRCGLLVVGGLGARQRHLALRQLPDHRTAVLVGGEAVTQGVVPPGQLGQGLRQACRVERAAQPHGQHDAVGGGPGDELLHEPQGFLGGGEYRSAALLAPRYPLDLDVAAGQTAAQQFSLGFGHLDGRHQTSPSTEFFKALRNSAASRPLIRRWS